MSQKLIFYYPDKFKGNFENNKKVLEEMDLVNDKSVRNKIAGYITTLKQKHAR